MQGKEYWKGFVRATALSAGIGCADKPVPLHLVSEKPIAEWRQELAYGPVKITVDYRQESGSFLIQAAVAYDPQTLAQLKAIGSQDLMISLRRMILATTLDFQCQGFDAILVSTVLLTEGLGKNLFLEKLALIRNTLMGVMHEVSAYVITRRLVASADASLLVRP